MELGAHSPSFISLRIQKGKETWSHTTFPKVWSFLPTLVQALPATLALMVLTTVLGSAFGLVLTWAQVSEDKVGAGLAKGYVFTLRCTPPIVLLFLVFYGLPQFFELVVGH